MAHFGSLVVGVFLGYIINHKGYHCHYPPTGCVYISRHVVFDEVTFPFKTPGSLFSPTHTIKEITTFSEWLTCTSDQVGISTSPLFISPLPTVDEPSQGVASTMSSMEGSSPTQATESTKCLLKPNTSLLICLFQSQSSTHPHKLI